MAAQFVVLVALVALANCAEVPAAQVDSDSSSFSYDVADPNTGDYKSQAETRKEGNVVGQYSLLQPDGTKRVVDYTADDANGFNAVVRNDPAVVAAAVSTAAPVSTTETAVTAAPAPVTYAEPVVVSARTYLSPFFYAARAVPSVYPSVYNPSVSTIYGPSVYPSVYNPSVYSTVYGPSVYSNAYAPSVYGAPVPWAAPTSYSAYW